MGYFVIILEVKEQKTGIGFADFDVREFERTNEVTLNGDPVLIEKEGNTITLTYEGKNKKRPPIGPISIS